MTGPTERTMLDALWARLSQRTAGGPPRHTMAEHVRYDPAWGHSIADAISVDTWRAGNRGHCLHGYEVKLPWSATAGLMRATAQTATYHALTPAQRLLLDRSADLPSLDALRLAKEHQ